MTVMTKRKLPARLLLFGDCELEGVGVIAPVQCLGTWCGDQVIYHSKKKKLREIYSPTAQFADAARLLILASLTITVQEAGGQDAH